MTVTFNGTTLPTREPITSERIGTLDQRWTFECYTDTLSSIDTILGYVGRVGTAILMSGKTSVQNIGGTVGSLVIDGTTFTNCSIQGPVVIREMPASGKGKWFYTVNIVRHTV
jgi:hypothetical protein